MYRNNNESPRRRTAEYGQAYLKLWTHVFFATSHIDDRSFFGNVERIAVPDDPGHQPHKHDIHHAGRFSSRKPQYQGPQSG